MESGSPPPDRPESDDAPGAGEGPQAPPPAGPGGPQSPAVGGPQSPAGGPQSPASPPPAYAPMPGGQPGPESPPGGYGGPVPPGGWQQPIARPQAGAGWVGQPLASWGSRVGAAIIDGLIIFIPAAILFFALVAGAVGLTGDDSDVSVGVVIGASLLWFLLVAAIALLYAPATMARQGPANGQTWGKQMLGIRVVRDNGDRMSFGWAALREVVVKGLAVGIASSIIPFIPYLLDVLWPLWDGENRALHDMAVQTHVISA